MMGALEVHEELAWTMKLGDGGHTCFELRDRDGVRWGWIVNAAASGWTAHVGSWGQAEDLGRSEPPVAQAIESFYSDADLAAAKLWVETEIAAQWRARAAAPAAP